MRSHILSQYFCHLKKKFKYYLGDKIKQNEMDRACGMNGRQDSCIMDFGR